MVDLIDFFIVYLVRTVVRNREDRIRTCDTLVPNQVLYQAELLPVQKDPFIRGGSDLYRILRTNSVTRVLLCHSRNDDVFGVSPNGPFLDEQGSRDKVPHGHFFMTLSWSHFHLGDKPLPNLDAICRLPWYNVCCRRPLVFAS